MRKIKLWVETGIIGGEHEEIIEVKDDITEEDLDELAIEFMWDHVECGWEEVKEEEDE